MQQVKGWLFLLSTMSALSVHATNPASTQYVDTLIAKLQFQVQSQVNTQGLPAGGTTGQFLVKTSDNNYDAQWVDRPGQYFVGQHALGGVVFAVYFDDAGVQHGLVAATADEPGNNAYSQQDAITQCNNTKQPSGYWILPTQAQLASLYANHFMIAPNDANGGFDNRINPVFLSAYWTSTSVPDAQGQPQGYFINFGLGYGAYDSTGLFSARCIHVF